MLHVAEAKLPDSDKALTAKAIAEKYFKMESALYHIKNTERLPNIEMAMDLAKGAYDFDPL